MDISVTRNAVKKLHDDLITQISLVQKGLSCSGPVFALVRGQATESVHPLVIDQLTLWIDPGYEAACASLQIDYQSEEPAGFIFRITSPATGGCGTCCGCQLVDQYNLPQDIQ